MEYYVLKDIKLSKKKILKAGDKISDSHLTKQQIINFKRSGHITDDEVKYADFMESKNKKNEPKDKSITSINVESKVSNDIIPPLVPELKVIEVPDFETEKTISNALEEAQKVINDANEYFASKKKNADEYFESIESLVDKQVEEIIIGKKMQLESQEIALNAREQQIEIDAKNAADKEKNRVLSELNNQRIQIEEKSADIETKIKKLLEDRNALDLEKATFKADVELDFKMQYESLLLEKTSLENEISHLEKTIKQKDNEIKGLRNDVEFIESQLHDLNDKNSEIRELELNVHEWKNKYENLEKSYKKKLTDISELNTQLLEYGSDPEQVFKEKKKLEEELIKLKNLHANMPDAEELAKLRKLRDSFEMLEKKYNELSLKNAELASENIDFKVMQNDIENYRKYIRVLEAQKHELEHELKRNAELYNNRTEKIFANLSEIDNDDSIITNYPDNPGITLQDICRDFRGYLAFRTVNPLYYDEDVIRTFIAGFASSRLMILEGLSGTGKSSLPRAFMDFIGAHTIKVPVQSSWKDRNDLLGFYNDFKKQYKETDFLKALYTATRDKNGIYLIVLDEMNLSRIEYYFADLLSVLEEPDPKDWKIELISDYASITPDSKAWPVLVKNGKLNILDNTWFIGTANKDDSTFMITDKVYDRSVVIDFQKKGEKGSKQIGYEYKNPIKLNNEDFQRLLRIAKSRMSENDKIGYKELITYLDSKVKDNFDITFGNRIQLQLDSFVPCYINCGGTYQEAVDIMFSKKVLRKLEGKYDDSTKLGMTDLIECLDNKKLSKFLPRTISTLKKMIEKI